MGEVPTDSGILVGVDGSAESDTAHRWATREATMRGVPITVMHVVPPIPEWPTPSWQSEIAEVCEQNARDVIEQARKTVVASRGESDPADLRAEVVSSTVVPTLIDASQHARMIVMGSRGMGALCRFLLGFGQQWSRAPRPLPGRHHPCRRRPARRQGADLGWC